jgi:hypothetical protein
MLWIEKNAVVKNVNEWTSKHGEICTAVEIMWLGGSMQVRVEAEHSNLITKARGLMGKQVVASGDLAYEERNFGGNGRTNVNFTLTSLEPSKS